MGVLLLGIKLLPVIVAAVSAVERLCKGHGKEKQDAAMDLIGVIAPLMGVQLGQNDLQVQAIQSALRQVIDAVVALHNAAKATNTLQATGASVTSAGGSLPGMITDGGASGSPPHN